MALCFPPWTMTEKNQAPKDTRWNISKYYFSKINFKVELWNKYFQIKKDGAPCSEIFDDIRIICNHQTIFIDLMKTLTMINHHCLWVNQIDHNCPWFYQIDHHCHRCSNGPHLGRVCTLVYGGKERDGILKLLSRLPSHCTPKVSWYFISKTTKNFNFQTWDFLFSQISLQGGTSQPPKIWYQRVTAYCATSY